MKRLEHNKSKIPEFSVTIKAQLSWHTIQSIMPDPNILSCNIILSEKKIESQEIELIYCNTSENVADIFTKPVGKIHFEDLRKKLSVVNNPFLH